MLHILLHLLVPGLLARMAFRDRWLVAYAWMLAGMAVDVDHLLASPIYDPDRCSIGFHPLHTAPAIAAYVALMVGPLIGRGGVGRMDGWSWRLHLLGIGLLIHMTLDAFDCVT